MATTAGKVRDGPLERIVVSWWTLITDSLLHGEIDNYLQGKL
jgi:hypothetical protein